MILNEHGFNFIEIPFSGCDIFVEVFRESNRELNEDPKLNKLHESQSLRLDISKAKNYLSWNPTWTIDRALDMIIDWHEALDNNINMRTFSIDQINLFEKESKEKNNEKR